MENVTVNSSRPDPAAIQRLARVSEDGLYRYELVRYWGDMRRHILWVMLNPSTADSRIDDPTIRRCIGFTADWGYNAFTVVNLYAFRATSPLRLRHTADPVGPMNRSAILGPALAAELIICAWGHAGPIPHRPQIVVNDLVTAGHKHKLRRLGTRKSGQPRHPLMLKKDLQPMPFW